MLAALLGAPAAVEPLATIRAFVAVEGESVYVFPSRRARKEYDTRMCTTAVVAQPGQLRRLVRASNRKQSVRLTLRTHANYFQDVAWSYNLTGHYKFGRTPLNPICENANLYEIVRVR